MSTLGGIVDDDPTTRVDTTPIKENDMSTLTGLTTMVLTADDVAAAADWYADVLGISPYFRQPPEGEPAYIEFRIGPDEDELGIMSRGFAPPGSKFFRDVLNFFDLRPQDIGPNSVSNICNFQVFCEVYLQEEPSVELFRDFFPSKPPHRVLGWS